VLAEVLTRSTWAERNRASRALIPLIIRVSQMALAAIAVITLLSELGYAVTSLIAGLGVGGLAVALAAQKTLENLFGAFAIGADQPFREGDFVRVDDFVATVESIGMRSTRFRTQDRTLITIPNGKLADMKVESFAARDRLRFASVLSLAYGTAPGQVRAVLEGVERTLRAQPKLWPDSVTTRQPGWVVSGETVRLTNAERSPSRIGRPRAISCSSVRRRCSSTSGSPISSTLVRSRPVSRLELRPSRLSAAGLAEWMVSSGSTTSMAKVSPAIWSDAAGAPLFSLPGTPQAASRSSTGV